MVLDSACGHETLRQDCVRRFLAENPRLKAISSHRLHPPLEIPGAIPIVMLRHPLDRARSAYDYAKRERTAVEHEFARTVSFQDYIAWSVSTRGDGAVLHDHQVRHLSDAAYRTADDERWRCTRADLEQAKINLTSYFAEFGLVRRFKDSCQLFNARCRPFIPAMNFVNYTENVSGDASRSEASALARVRADLDDATYQALCENNQLDIELYEFACRLFDRRLTALHRFGGRASAEIRFLAGRVRQRLAEADLYREWPGSVLSPHGPAVMILPLEAGQGH